ncbi:FAD-linked oxidase C-terminal domain-containing protein [Maricurvus nonylphenolicus]
MSNQALISGLKNIVGHSWVHDRASESAAPYLERFGFSPVCVVLPANTEELETIIKSADKDGFSVWVLPNTAGNGGLVGSSDNDKAVVMLDLSRMNQIIDVDPDAAYALVEPGVSYQQLYDYLQDKHPNLWIDCDRNSQHSVAGSICAREYGYTFYGDHFFMQCGMEVMLADGNLVRTGMGSLPGNNTWQLYKFGFGPYVDGLFTQSDLGIVTKIGLWLMPAPAAYQPFMVSLPRLEDLSMAVELMRPLKINMVVGNTVIISSPAMDAAPYQRRSDYIENGAVDEGALKGSLNLGQWNLYGAFYGSEKNVEAMWSTLEPALKLIPGAKVFKRGERADDKVWQNREKMMRGVPVEGMDNIVNWQGDSVLSLSATAPLAGEDSLKLQQMVSSILSEHGFDYLCEYALAMRSMSKRINLPFDSRIDGSREQAEKCLYELATRLSNAGYGITHISTGYLPVALEGFKSGGLVDLQARLKDALDPKGILAAS